MKTAGLADHGLAMQPDPSRAYVLAAPILSTVAARGPVAMPLLTGAKLRSEAMVVLTRHHSQLVPLLETLRSGFLEVAELQTLAMSVSEEAQWLLL